MAVYEYRCNSCRRRVEVFVRGFSPPNDPKCNKCGSKELSRVYSPFTTRRGKNDRGVYDEILSDAKLTRGMMRNDPRAMAEWSRKMAHATGEDVTPESQEIMNKLDKCQDISEDMAEMKKKYLPEEASSGGTQSGSAED